MSDNSVMGGLESLISAAKSAGGRGGAPVDQWNPPHCGSIDMRIAADGTWFYQGTPIGRKALVQLFASVLRKDPDEYVLVTPVERVTIDVEDAPFLAIEMAVQGEGRDQVIAFRTNVEDSVTVDADHPLRFETEERTDGLKPYVRVRGGLEALVKRALFFDLAELGTCEMHESQDWFGVWSAGQFFPMVPMAMLDGFV
jgi:hypothetical protein